MNTINLKYFNILAALNIPDLKDYYIWEAEKFSPKSGVYIIYGRNDKPLYVGEAQSIQERIAEHVEEGEKGKYKDVKESRKRNIERQQNGEEIIPDENQAWYKRYFYKVKFIECEPVERKMLE
jgi:predicted GIY-YIG superfamily endonuclease